MWILFHAYNFNFVLQPSEYMYYVPDYLTRVWCLVIDQTSVAIPFLGKKISEFSHAEENFSPTLMHAEWTVKIWKYGLRCKYKVHTNTHQILLFWLAYCTEAHIWRDWCIRCCKQYVLYFTNYVVNVHILYFWQPQTLWCYTGCILLTMYIMQIIYLYQLHMKNM